MANFTTIGFDGDLDAQSPAADLVRVYLNGIGKTALLTAADEVELAKRSEAGLYAQHLLDTRKRLGDNRKRDLASIARDGQAEREENQAHAQQAKDHTVHFPAAPERDQVRAGERRHAEGSARTHPERPWPIGKVAAQNQETNDAEPRREESGRADDPHQLSPAGYRQQHRGAGDVVER